VRESAFCEGEDALYVEFIDGLGMLGSRRRATILTTRNHRKPTQLTGF
jgi:hypothetical protein